MNRGNSTSSQRSGHNRSLGNARRATHGRPSILVIILDALRAKNVSSYGYSVRTTPHLDRFAGENVLFRRAYTTSTWTIPTHASMLSGLYLSQHRLENIRRDRRFHESVVPLPAALRPAGYETAAFSQNMLFTPAHHFDCFDTFYGPEDLRELRWLSGQLFAGSSGTNGLVDRFNSYLEKMFRPRAFFDAIFDWIGAQDSSTPFFLMANVLNAHYPWAPSPDILLSQLRFNPRHLLRSEFTLLKPWQFNSGLKQVTDTHRRVWRSLYDAAAIHLDRELGRFLERLRRWHGWQDLVVVVTSDHGEMLGDYRDLVGHMLSLHDNILHVPLVVRHPDYPSELTVEGVVQTVDLYPSIVEWAGVGSDSIPTAQLQRPSYSKAVDSPDSLSGYAFAEEDYSDSYDVIDGPIGTNPKMKADKFPRRQVSVRSATHKYIWCDDRPGEFYDLLSDPSETNNVFSQNADAPVMAELEQILEGWYSGLEVFPPRIEERPGEEDAELIERLRRLGYVE